MALTVRKRKNSRYWFARGYVPMRKANGSILFERIEESTRETSKARAVRFAADRAQYYHEQAYRPKAKSISFTDAAITYVESKNPSKRDRGFVAKLVGHFGEIPINEIDQAAVAEAAHKLYGRCSASTHNRAVFAPIVTILRLSGWRTDFQRPRAIKTVKPLPDEGWFDSILPHCGNRLAALLIFITLTGRRITEALEAIDNGDGTCTIGRTKTGGSLVCAIPSDCRRLLARASRRGERMFTYGDRHNVYRALRQACKRAGVPYYGTHAIGRHSFATRLLKKGFNTFTVAKMGGWASTRMVELHYGHLAHDETNELLKAEGEIWGRELEKRLKKAQNGPT